MTHGHLLMPICEFYFRRRKELSAPFLSVQHKIHKQAVRM